MMNISFTSEGYLSYLQYTEYTTYFIIRYLIQTTTIDQLLYINKNAFCYNLLLILYINDAMNQNGHHDCMESVC